MYFVALAARLSEYLKPPEPLNWTKPPVSVSQIWPLVTEATCREALALVAVDVLVVVQAPDPALVLRGLRELAQVARDVARSSTSAAMTVHFLHTLFMVL